LKHCSATFTAQLHFLQKRPAAEDSDYCSSPAHPAIVLRENTVTPQIHFFQTLAVGYKIAGFPAALIAAISKYDKASQKSVVSGLPTVIY
jgi:hypothetical protein